MLPAKSTPLRGNGANGAGRVVRSGAVRPAAIRAFVSALAFAAAGIPAYVGQWQTFSQQNAVTAMLPFEGSLFVGTTGGIRKVNPADFSEVTFDNLDGLKDVGIVGLATTGDNRLWAVSGSGFVQEYRGGRWHAYGTGYASERWRMNPGAVLGAGSLLVLGSEKGLSFFDTRRKLALVNLTRIGSLAGPSVLSLARKEDTLFIGTAQGIFKAAVDWSNLLSDKVSIHDPNIWSLAVPPGKDDRNLPPPVDSVPVDSFSLPPRRFERIAFADGRLDFSGRGALLTGLPRVEAFQGRKPVIGGDTLHYPGIDTLFTTAARLGGALFLGNKWALLGARTLTRDSALGFAIIPSSREMPPEQLLTISAAGGHVYAQSNSNLYAKRGRAWTAVPGYALPYSPDISIWTLKNLTSDRNGTAYIGSWGQGLARIREGRQTLWDGITHTCIDTVLTDYTVVRSNSDVADRSIWAAVMGKESTNRYQMIHLDVETERITCLGQWGDAVHTHAVKVLPGSTLGVASQQGIDLFTYGFSASDPGRPEIAFSKKLITRGQAIETWDLEQDRFGRIWTVMGDRLGYADSLGEAARVDLDELEGFRGRECRIMEADLDRNIWMGCSNGLFLLEPAATVEATRVTRFSIDDGLVSNVVFDLSVDRQSGQVWIATDQGISMYDGPVKARPSGLQGVKAYPNPFLAKHERMLFDGLPPDARVSILTQSGNVVKTFGASEIRGNQCQWDGANARGTKVKPGIYFYNVSSGSKSKRGKIILAR